MSWQRWASSYFAHIRTKYICIGQLEPGGNSSTEIKEGVSSEELCDMRGQNFAQVLFPWDAAQYLYESPTAHGGNMECCPSHCQPRYAVGHLAALLDLLSHCWGVYGHFCIFGLKLDAGTNQECASASSIYYFDWHSSKEWISALIFCFKRFKQIWNTLFILKMIFNFFFFPGLFFVSCDLWVSDFHHNYQIEIIFCTCEF